MELLEDLGRIRDVLRANACDKQVGDDMLVALLELYANDQQRVDLVVLELEEMLGRSLAVNAQQARWQELQQNSSQPIRGNEGNEIEVMYEKIVVPRNDEVIVNVIRTVEHSRTVGTLPHLNDQTPGTCPNSSLNPFSVNGAPGKSEAQPVGNTLVMGVSINASTNHRSERTNVQLSRTDLRNSPSPNTVEAAVLLNQAPLPNPNAPLPSVSQIRPILPRPSINTAVPDVLNLVQNIRTAIAASFPPLSTENSAAAASARTAHPVNPRKRPAPSPFPPAAIPSTSRNPAPVITRPSETPQCANTVSSSTIPSTSTANTFFKGTPTCFRDYVPVERKTGESILNFATNTAECSSSSSTTDSLAKAESISDLRERQAIDLFQSLLDSTPDMNIHYAAFVSAETVLLPNSDENDVTRLKNMPIVKHSDVWKLPRFMNDDHESIYKHTVDYYLKVQLDFMIMALPEADPEYLEDKIKATDGNQDRIRTLLDKLMEEGGYPSRADYTKRKEYEELSKKFFSTEEFLEMYEDPFKYFYDETRSTKPNYQDEAMNQLKCDFRSTSVNVLRRVFRDHRFHYVPSYYELVRSPELHWLKTKRSLRECQRHKTTDLQLLQELAFVRNEEQIYEYLRNKEQLRTDALNQARANNMLLECPICCENEFLDEDFAKCVQGHGICSDCVRRQSEELIGQMKNHVRCLNPECTAEYSLATLRRVLGKSVYVRLEKRRQAEEVIAAGIEGLESCPFCEYCEVPNDADRLFRCKNPDCVKVSCRLCRESDHSPLRCEEYAVRVRLQSYVETKMTDALLRECPACKRKFVKADGCNKMVCVCSAVMCYICRKQIKDYSHFAPLPPVGAAPPAAANPHSGKCPLYSDTEKMHEEEVARSAAVARAELIAQNPNIRVDLVLGKGKALQSR